MAEATLREGSLKPQRRERSKAEGLGWQVAGDIRLPRGPSVGARVVWPAELTVVSVLWGRDRAEFVHHAPEGGRDVRC
jgi:hypothetical protein